MIKDIVNFALKLWPYLPQASDCHICLRVASLSPPLLCDQELSLPFLFDTGLRSDYLLLEQPHRSFKLQRRFEVPAIGQAMLIKKWRVAIMGHRVGRAIQIQPVLLIHQGYLSELAFSVSSSVVKASECLELCPQLTRIRYYMNTQVVEQLTISELVRRMAEDKLNQYDNFLRAHSLKFALSIWVEENWQSQTPQRRQTIGCFCDFCEHPELRDKAAGQHHRPVCSPRILAQAKYF